MKAIYAAAMLISVAAHAETTGTVRGPQAGPGCTSWYIDEVHYALTNAELNGNGVAMALNTASAKGGTVTVKTLHEVGLDPANVDQAVCNGHGLPRPALVIPLN